MDEKMDGWADGFGFYRTGEEILTWWVRGPHSVVTTLGNERKKILNLLFIYPEEEFSDL